MSHNGTLTELERLKLENFALKHNFMQQQMGQLIAERAAYIKQIEAAHPGCTWDEQAGLVRDDKPPVTEEARSWEGAKPS